MERRLLANDISEQKKMAHERMCMWTCLYDVVNAAQDIKSKFHAEQIAFRLWEWDFPTPVDVLLYNRTVGHVMAIPEPRIWEVLRVNGAAEYIYQMCSYQCMVLSKFCYDGLELLNPFYPPLGIFSQESIDQKHSEAQNLFKGTFDIYPPEGHANLPEHVTRYVKPDESITKLKPEDFFNIAVSAPKPTKLVTTDPTERCVDVGRPSLCFWSRVQAYRKRYDGYDITTPKAPNALASARVHAIRNDYNYCVFTYSNVIDATPAMPIHNPRAEPTYNAIKAQDEIDSFPIAAVYCNADRSVERVMKNDLFIADLALAKLQPVTGHEGDAYPKHAVSPGSFCSSTRAYSPQNPTAAPPPPPVTFRALPIKSVSFEEDDIADNESIKSEYEIQLPWKNDIAELIPIKIYSVTDIVPGEGIPFTEDKSLSAAMQTVAAEFGEQFSEIGFNLLSDAEKIEHINMTVETQALEISSAKTHVQEIRDQEESHEFTKFLLAMGDRRVERSLVHHARYLGLLKKFAPTVLSLVPSNMDSDSD